MRSWRDAYLLGLAIRVLVVVAAAAAFSFSVATPGLAVARFVAGVLLVLAAAELWRFVRRTNRAVGRFLDAVRHADGSQGFASLGGGSGFEELGEALDAAVKRLRDERAKIGEEARFLSALLDDAPAPLLSVEGDFVEPVNKAARRLFAGADAGPAENFSGFGASFAQALVSLRPGDTKLVVLTVDGAKQSAVVTAAAVQRLGTDIRIVSVQPVQGTIDAVEIAAQSDLVRVLTHEIMNSITPVTSLAQTAAATMAQVDTGDDEDVAEARMAVDALARRAAGVMTFVESYRTMAEPPRLKMAEVEAGEWLAGLVSVHRASVAGRAVPLEVDVPERAIRFDGDADHLGQVILNLLKNAAQAAAGESAEPRTWLSADVTRGGRLRIAVEDNGPGIPAASRSDIFLPFYTTKAAGSGIGLSLARQIVLAHSGTIEVADSAHGGAAIVCTL